MTNALKVALGMMFAFGLPGSVIAYATAHPTEFAALCHRVLGI